MYEKGKQLLFSRPHLSERVQVYIFKTFHFQNENAFIKMGIKI